MRVPRWLVRTGIRRPRTTLFAWLVLLLLSGFGIRLVDVDTSTDSVLDRSDPVAWPFYRRSLGLFGGDEVVVVAIKAKEPFDPAALARVSELTDELSAVPGIRRVDSLSTVPHIEVSSDGVLNLDPALVEGSHGAIDRDRLAAKVSRDRIARRVLVSDDGTLFAVNAFLENNVDGRFERIVEEIRARLPTNAFMSGVPVFRTAINTKTASEIGLFVGLTIAGIALLLYLIFSSILAVVIPLLAAAAGSAGLLSAMGFAGEPLSLTTMVLPSVMLAIGCANVMHVITQAAGVSDPDALMEALDPVILPVLLSGLTTTFGFLAITGVPIDAVQATGTYGAIGVVVVLAATLTAVPAALALWPLPRTANRWSDWIRDRVCPFVCRVALRKRRSLVFLWVGVAMVAVAGTMRLRVETDATTWFPRRSSIRESYLAIREGLSGISPMNVVVESGAGEVVTRPEVLEAIAGLAAFLEELPQVGRAISIADPLEQLHSGLLGERGPAEEDGSRLPASAEAIEQYLLLLESVDQLRDLITLDRMHANVVLRVDNNGSADLKRVAELAEAWWRKHGVEGYSATATGVMYEFARAEDKIALGQLRGMAFALVAIGVVLYSILREVRLTLATIVTNAVPIGVSFGVMGILGLPLDAGTVVVGNLAIGIAIDETLHLSSGLRSVDPATGPREQALLAALRLCLPSILYTTAVIAVGFGVLGFSRFSFTRDLGLLTVGVMVLCLLADLFLLPALVVSPESRTEPARSRMSRAG